MTAGVNNKLPYGNLPPVGNLTEFRDGFLKPYLRVNEED